MGCDRDGSEDVEGHLGEILLIILLHQQQQQKLLLLLLLLLPLPLNDGARTHEWAVGEDAAVVLAPEGARACTWPTSSKGGAMRAGD